MDHEVSLALLKLCQTPTVCIAEQSPLYHYSMELLWGILAGIQYFNKLRPTFQPRPIRQSCAVVVEELDKLVIHFLLGRFDMLVGVASINGKPYNIVSWMGMPARIYTPYHAEHPCTPLAHTRY